GVRSEARIGKIAQLVGRKIEYRNRLPIVRLSRTEAVVEQRQIFAVGAEHGRNRKAVGALWFAGNWFEQRLAGRKRNLFLRFLRGKLRSQRADEQTNEYQGKEAAEVHDTPHRDGTEDDGERRP